MRFYLNQIKLHYRTFNHNIIFKTIMVQGFITILINLLFFNVFCKLFSNNLNLVKLNQNVYFYN